MNYRIVEENRQIWIERSRDGKSWDMVQYSNVPRYHPTVADARSWVETLRRGRVIHSVEDDGLQWFLDRVGKVVYGHYPNKSGIQAFPIIDEDHARHLHTASVEMGYVYTDAPNIAQDERKAESGNKVHDEWEANAMRYIAEKLKNNAIVNHDGEETYPIQRVSFGRDSKIVIDI